MSLSLYNSPFVSIFVSVFFLFHDLNLNTLLVSAVNVHVTMSSGSDVAVSLVGCATIQSSYLCGIFSEESRQYPNGPALRLLAYTQSLEKFL